MMDLCCLSQSPSRLCFSTHKFSLAGCFNFNAAPFKALVRYFEAGRLRLLLTDVTISEG